jgi:hypothetical protein
MSRVAKHSAAATVKVGPRSAAEGAEASVPSWIPPQLCEPVDEAPSGPQWLYEIKLDGFRMAARIDCSFGAAAHAKRARPERQISERDRRPQKHQREDRLFRKRCSDRAFLDHV